MKQGYRRLTYKTADVNTTNSELRVYRDRQEGAAEMVKTTAALPRTLEGFPGGKRNNIIQEIYKTEYTYVNSLEVLIDVSQLMLVLHTYIYIYLIGARDC